MLLGFEKFSIFVNRKDDGESSSLAGGLTDGFRIIHEPAEQTSMSSSEHSSQGATTEVLESIFERDSAAKGNGKQPRVLLSRTTPNQNVRNALRSLVEHGMLAEFWTTFVWNPKSIWNSLLPDNFRKQLSRRAFSEAPSELVKSAPWREIVRLGLRGTPLQDFLSSRERPFSVGGMESSFDAHVAKQIRQIHPDIVYAYDGGALRTFREAKKAGVAAVLEHTSGYWRWERRLFLEEAERNPDFAGIIPGLMDSEAHRERTEEELRLADFVIVSSQHVRETFRGVIADERIRVIRYGAPPVRNRKRVPQDGGRALKVLFAGSLIQRKGISYVLDAAEMLGDKIELTLIGSRPYTNAKLEKACTRYRWIQSLPHSQILGIMQESDVLLLPSLSDAFGLVVTEALACGLPVIVTPNTGASEIIHDGREGYLVPICRGDLIAFHLETLHADRALLAEMSRHAQQTAAQNSWHNYRANWAQIIRSLAGCSR